MSFFIITRPLLPEVLFMFLHVCHGQQCQDASLASAFSPSTLRWFQAMAPAATRKAQYLDNSSMLSFGQVLPPWPDFSSIEAESEEE